MKSSGLKHNGVTGSVVAVVVLTIPPVRGCIGVFMFEVVTAGVFAAGVVILEETGSDLNKY